MKLNKILFLLLVFLVSEVVMENRIKSFKHFNSSENLILFFYGQYFFSIICIPFAIVFLLKKKEAFKAIFRQLPRAFVMSFCFSLSLLILSFCYVHIKTGVPFRIYELLYYFNVIYIVMALWFSFLITPLVAWLFERKLTK